MDPRQKHWGGETAMSEVDYVLLRDGPLAVLIVVSWT